MGQYFKAVILNKKNNPVGAITTKPYFMGGMKIREHYYIGNDFVEAVCAVIANEPQKVVWAGDSSNIIEKSRKKILKENVYRQTELLKLNDNMQIPLNKKGFKILLNKTKKLYVDLNKIVENEVGYAVHPLPVLCYYSKLWGERHWGEWAKDTLTMCEEEKDIPKGYKELIFDYIDR